MIKTNELRIGNWYEHDGKYYQVKSIMNGESYPYVKPIPLTPEILEKAGFTKGKSIGLTLDIRFDETPFYSAYLWFEFLAGSVYLYTLDDGHNIELANFIYLHQLQNLYFALTGEELEINL